MNEMVERVSHAIQEVMPHWLAQDGRVDDLALAFAALNAMRQPTADVVEAVWRQTLGGTMLGAERAFIAGINAALAD